MSDPYLYPGTAKVLRNLFNIHDSKMLDLAEAEQSRANMMLLYDAGFDDFSTGGICTIHKILFGDVYDWAGHFRVINIQKREKLLAGASVWYSDVDTIEADLDAIWTTIHALRWDFLPQKEFVRQLIHTFPLIWKVHPFREGNTRTVVMLLTFFVEKHGYFIDKELLATSAGYVRNAFVLASLKDYPEYEPLEKILMDAVQTEPGVYVDDNSASANDAAERYSRYRSDNYLPQDHEPRSGDYNAKDYKA